MAITRMKDSFVLLKETVKSRISDNLLSRMQHPAMPIIEKISKELKIKKIKRIIDGKPNSYVVVTNNLIIRIPLDKLTTARLRLNKIMLKKLSKTSISDFVPRFIGEGKIDNYVYFCEERLPGNALDVPLSKMDEMLLKAANFITDFHQETGKIITLDERNFEKLFSRFFNSLSNNLVEEYKEKLTKIERELKKCILGKSFITVWQHGDFKIENVLFNTSNWKIEGVIDWDLARIHGLSLLDIFYLLLYKSSLELQESINEIFNNRFLKGNFTTLEKEIINRYLKSVNLPNDFIYPMLIIFWFHHIVVRYQCNLSENCASAKEWFNNNVYKVIDFICQQKKGNFQCF